MVKTKREQVNDILAAHPDWLPPQVRDEFKRLHKDDVSLNYIYDLRKKRGLLPAYKQANGQHPPISVEEIKVAPLAHENLPEAPPATAKEALTADQVIASMDVVGDLARLADRVGSIHELKRVVDAMAESNYQDA